MDKKQPEAQERKFWKRLCALNRFSFFYMGGGVARASDKSGNWIEVHSAQEIVDDAECEVSTQHARIADLEAQLEAIGAGGVSGPLIGQPQAMPDLSQLTERGAKAWAGVDAQGLREGFTAADMATVSAQGFRDGVASLAASAWEPVAWLYESPMPDGSVFTGASAERLQVGVGTPPSTIEKPLYLAAPPTAQAEGWISVDERLPEVGVTVLVYEPFRHGEDWPDTVRIFFDYICPDYDGWHNHCASYEHFMIVGGSNACGPDVTCIGPSEKAPYTHWMPLPAAPGPADGESNV